jgi:hypothetical protein
MCVEGPRLSMCCRGVPGIGAETSEAPAERKTTSEGAAVLGQTDGRRRRVKTGSQPASNKRCRRVPGSGWCGTRIPGDGATRVDGRKAGDYSPRLAEYTSVLTAPRCKGTGLENENKKRLLGVDRDGKERTAGARNSAPTREGGNGAAECRAGNCYINWQGNNKRRAR